MRTATVLSLAGGFAFGAAQAGAQLVGMWENGFGQDLVESNLSGVPYLDEGRSNPPRGLDFILGCPPCAGWSSGSAGLAQRFNPDHAINDGIRRWFEAVETAQPAIACFECVQNLAHYGSDLYGPLARRLEEHGFSWKIVLYDNQWLGVPQRRPRMLFWAYRGYGELEFPAWWDGRPYTPVYNIDVSRTADWWDWHVRLDPTRKAVDRLVPYVEPGSNVRRVPFEAYWEHYYEEGRREGWPSFTYRRLHADRPAPAMMGNSLYTIIHWKEDRWITGRELARIMGYPDGFVLDWEGARRTITDHHNLSAWLTKAVSPVVGRWAATTAEAYLEQPASSTRFPGGLVAL